MESVQSGVYTQRFAAYLSREVAQKAAKSISNGAEIEFHIRGSGERDLETFTFTKASGTNQVKAGPASDPQLVFTMTEQAAKEILDDPAEDIGAIGVAIMKRVVSSDPACKVSVKFKAGFLTLFGKGYFGVLTAGGAEFGSYLASKGLGGMGAIKAALKNLKG